MRKLLLIIMLSIGLSANSFIEEDKISHAAAGIIIYGGCLALDKALDIPWLDPNKCLVSVYVAAIFKEVYDSTSDNHTADFNDITATVFFPTTTFVLYSW